MKIKEEYNEFMTGTEHDKADEENIKNLYEKIDPDLKAVKGDKGDRGPRGFTGLQVVRADVIQNSETSAKIKLVVQDEYEILTNEFDLPRGEKGRDGIQGIDGKNGVGIKSIQQGEAVIGDEFTETPLTITLDDNSQQNFVVKAKNGSGNGLKDSLWVEADGNWLKPAKSEFGVKFSDSVSPEKFGNMNSSAIRFEGANQQFVNIGVDVPIENGVVAGISGIDTRSIINDNSAVNKEYVDSNNSWNISETGQKVVAKEGVVGVGVGLKLGEKGQETQMTKTGFVGWAADGSAIVVTTIAGDGTKKGIVGIDDESINRDSAATNKKYVDERVKIVEKNVSLDTDVTSSVRVDWVKGATGIQVLQGEDTSVVVLIPRVDGIKLKQYLLSQIPPDLIIQLHFPEDENGQMIVTYQKNTGKVASNGTIDLRINYFFGGVN